MAARACMAGYRDGSIIATFSTTAEALFGSPVRVYVSIRHVSYTAAGRPSRMYLMTCADVLG